MSRRLLLPRGALNEAYVPYLFSPRRYQLYFGGASSGKSCFLATRLVLDTLQGRNTLVCRQVARTIRTSVWNETLKAASRLGLTGCFRVGRTEMSITCTSNGAQILFCGLDDVEKVKSISPARGALTDVWIEEATETAYRDYKQLDKRLRGQSAFPKRMTLSFNPVYKTHWIYREFFGCWQDGAREWAEGEVSILKTTYRDNRFLTEDDRRALESERDPYFRSVYTLGEWGVLGEAIFPSFRREDLSARFACEDRRRYGLDFGFADDPCACVCCAYDARRKTVYVYAELCERGLTNDRLAERLRAFAGGGYVICDSAEPKSIAELCRQGVRALPARKGPDSVMHGVQWLRAQQLVIDTRCTHLSRELSLYQWKRDRDGNALREPSDRDNHLIDALRYALENEMEARYAAAESRPVW